MEYFSLAGMNMAKDHQNHMLSPYYVTIPVPAAIEYAVKILARCLT